MVYFSFPTLTTSTCADVWLHISGVHSAHRSELHLTADGHEAKNYGRGLSRVPPA